MDENDGLSISEKLSCEDVKIEEEKFGFRLELKLVKGEVVFIEEELLFVFLFNWEMLLKV